jgi:fermentation-respiration switch protein FrsA (DUF1100 family)
MMRVRWRDADMTPGKWLRALIVILSFFVLVYLIANPMLQTYLLAHPFRWKIDLTAERTGVPVERVSFQAVDGVPLVGWFVPGVGSGETIVVSHGSGANGAASYDGVDFLQQAGYNVFVFDHRAHGQSGGRASTLGPREVQDLRGAVTYLQTRADVDPHAIGAFGCSMGSGVVVGAAAEDPRIRAVVAEAIYADLGELWDRFGYVGIQRTSIHWSWGVPMRWATWLWTGEWIAAYRPEALVEHISPRPLLLIHGQEDNAACTVADARRVYAAAVEPKELWIVPGAGHCNARYRRPQKYEARVQRFFDQALRPQ